jgi:hypothetical protein
MMSEHTSELLITGRRISRRHVRNVWRRLFPDKIMPPIDAFRVTRKEWGRIKAQSDAHNAACGYPTTNAEASMWEHGEIVEGDAGVIRTMENYLVLVWEDQSLEPLLEHELMHIARGDPDIRFRPIQPGAASGVE